MQNHPMRHALSNELHARPFPELTAPCSAAFLAIKEPVNAAERDRDLDRKHLLALLDRFGASHPAPEADHYSGQLGRAFLKWEMHTEFVTYTLFINEVAERPFSGTLFSMFPKDWLDAMPGTVLTSALVRAEEVADEDALRHALDTKLAKWFIPESLAVSRVVDGNAVIAADFRIDEHDHIRLAVLCRPGIEERRLGRIVQRAIEIETYKTASMLTLPVARKVSRRVAELDHELAEIVQNMARGAGDESQTLDRLLRMSAEIEALSSDSAFRFGAAAAYARIVNQRISALREQRIEGRQLFSEFMMRRYDPAMRTCESSEERLRDLSSRSERAANLLRTRVDVAAAEQDHKVLKTMDKRAALQLRLQETVEGLSVVAISYYAVSLGGYLLAPLAKMADIDKSWISAAITIPVVAAVWAGLSRLRRAHLKKETSADEIRNT